MRFPFATLACMVVVTLSGGALAQTSNGVDPDAPTVAKFSQVRPYEITEGTPIQVGLQTDESGIWGMIVGTVSLSVYDSFHNVAIPKGSRLIGRTIRQVNDRREVQWDGLQLPSTATLQLHPPLEGCMPDGSAGITVSSFKRPGARVAALVTKAFSVPH